MVRRREGAEKLLPTENDVAGHGVNRSAVRCCYSQTALPVELMIR